MIKKLWAIFNETRSHFQGQEEGEEVLMVVRRHPFTLLAPALAILVASIAPLFIKNFLPISQEILEVADFIISLWYGALWIIGSYILMIYSLNTVIITNKRVVENEQLGFFNRRVSELFLFRIQDIAIETHGFFETLLSFGTLAIQTAAEKREFVFPKTPHPEKVKSLIMQAAVAHKHKMSVN